MRKVCGVGINDLPRGSCTDENGKRHKFYKTWQSMLERCYSGKHPQYEGCSVSDEWKTLSNFKRWYDENYISGFQLDKDLFVSGNRIYGPGVCFFVPPELNCLFTGTRYESGDKSDSLPTGVYKNGNSFQAMLHRGNGQEYLGTFSTIFEADKVYRQEKAKHCLFIIDKYRNIVNNELLERLEDRMIKEL